jgi:hypothetical protein
MYFGSRILLNNPFSRGILSVLSICLFQSFLALYSFCTVSSTNLTGSVLVLVQYSTALLADKSSLHTVLHLWQMNSSLLTVLPPGRRILHSVRIPNLYESSVLTVLSCGLSLMLQPTVSLSHHVLE